MNCRQARSLFSARVDGELSSLEERELQKHLHDCSRGCAERWVSFETTVRLVHTLPAIEADPSFVGQVLDRVRGYEAGHLRPRMEVRRSLGTRIREFLGDRAAAFPVPARLVSVGALGIALGFVLASGLNWRATGGATSISGFSDRITVPVPAASKAIRSGTGSQDAPRPFADLVDDLSTARGSRTLDDSMAQSPRRAVAPEGAAGEGPIRIVKGDGKPQITF